MLVRRSGGRATPGPCSLRNPVRRRSAPGASRGRGGWSARRAATGWGAAMISASVSRDFSPPESGRPAHRPSRRENRSRRESRAGPARAPAGRQPHAGAGAAIRPGAAARAGAERSSRSQSLALAAAVQPSGISSPARSLTSVDLPAPLGPSRPTRAPVRKHQVDAPRAPCARRTRPDACSSVSSRSEAGAGARKAKLNGVSTCAAAMQLHPRQRLEPALCLARLGRLGTEALDEAAQVRDFALLLGEGGLLHRRGWRRAAARTRCNCPCTGAGVRASRCARCASTVASRNSRSWEISSRVPG